MNAFSAKRLPLRHPVGLALLILLLAPQPVDSRGRSDERAIRELLSRTARANNEGDVEGWLAAFDPDAVYMPSGMPAVTDRGALREIAASGFGSWDAEIEIVPVDLTVTGEWAFARARVRGHVTSRSSGERIEIDNKELLVFRLHPEEGWRIYRMMINSNG